ncbi:MAG TPA: hypothetical protein VFZ48_00870 [Candidatus Saccharimonadales bacterium]
MTKLTGIVLEAQAFGPKFPDRPDPVYSVDASHSATPRHWLADVIDFKGNDGQPVQYGMVQKLPPSMDPRTQKIWGSYRLVFTLRVDTDDDLLDLIAGFQSQVGRRELECSPSVSLRFEQGDQKLFLASRLNNLRQWRWGGCGRTTEGMFRTAIRQLSAAPFCVEATTFSLWPERPAVDGVASVLHPETPLIKGATQIAEVLFPIAPRW